MKAKGLASDSDVATAVAGGQLEGIRVLDLSRVLAGPLAGQMLGDLGAEVIKVERPIAGDEARSFGPPFVDEHGPRGGLESAIFLCANRNKKGIAIDFNRPDGQAILKQLIARSDVLIENYKVNTLARYGLDYESARAINPGIIYCSITGYGQTGPNRNQPGYDAIFQGEGGLMHSIGYPDDHPAGGPMRVGISIVDVITSLYADIAILAALHKREARGGSGEHIDLSLLDCCIAATSHHAVHYLMSGELPKRRGNFGAGGGVPSGLFHCANGDIVITVGNDDQFQRLCGAINRPNWISDPRFARNQDRVANRDVLNSLLQQLFLDQPVEIWSQRLQSADLSVGKVNTLAQVFADPHVKARGMKVDLLHRNGSALPLVANPIRFTADPVTEYAAPAALGEHTRQVLADILAIPAADIERLVKSGAIGVPEPQSHA